MNLTKENIATVSDEWEAQRKRIKLARTLMQGTQAMRDAGKLYLPERNRNESTAKYQRRLQRSFLNNEYKRTVNYMTGQVFKREVSFEGKDKADEILYDEDVFNAFAEDVDTTGINISVFCNGVFKNGLIDGVVFVVTDYSQIALKTNPDGSVYKDKNGNTYYMSGDDYKIKTLGDDKSNKWRPFWVLVKAEQVLDAWCDTQNGNTVFRAFRYYNSFEREKASGERVKIHCIRAFFPDHWEVWESEDGKEYALAKSQTNPLGKVPVDYFMPGEQLEGLTAQPPLEDLAWMNLDHWQASSNHNGLMEFARAPVWLLKSLRVEADNNGKAKDIEFGPDMFCQGDTDSDIVSRGVDPASVEKSFQDLKLKEENMNKYSLQVISQGATGMTATLANIDAATADAQLVVMANKLKDCMENALVKVAKWLGSDDGPGLFVNTEFRKAVDPAMITLLSSMVEKGQLPLIDLYNELKKQEITSMDFTEFEKIYEEEQEGKANANNFGFTPSFGSFPPDGQEINKQQ